MNVCNCCFYTHVLYTACKPEAVSLYKITSLIRHLLMCGGVKLDSARSQLSTCQKRLTWPRAPYTIWSDLCCSLVALIVIKRLGVGSLLTAPMGQITWVSHSFYMLHCVHFCS